MADWFGVDVTDVSAPDRCTISMDNRLLCGNPAIPNAPVPVCYEHTAMLLAFAMQQLDTVAAGIEGQDVTRLRILATLSDGLGRKSRNARQATEDASVIYYVRVGEYVKIGTTTHLANRIRSYPPGSRLLATEPGGRDVEERRLAEFAHSLAAGNEWFMPTPRLMAHIESLRDAAA